MKLQFILDDKVLFEAFGCPPLVGEELTVKDFSIGNGSENGKILNFVIDKISRVIIVNSYAVKNLKHKDLETLVPASKQIKEELGGHAFQFSNQGKNVDYSLHFAKIFLKEMD